jgi:hypothetical protein
MIDCPHCGEKIELALPKPESNRPLIIAPLNHIFSSPKPSYGVLVWAGWLALSVFSRSRTFPIQILCYLVSLGACAWWFVFSRTHERREFWRRMLGYIAFGFGSMLPLSAASVVLLGPVRGFTETYFLFVLCLAVAAGLIAGAFHVVFRRHENAA